MNIKNICTVLTTLTGYAIYDVWYDINNGKYYQYNQNTKERKELPNLQPIKLDLEEQKQFIRFASNLAGTGLYSIQPVTMMKIYEALINSSS